MLAELLIARVLEGVSVQDALEGISMPITRTMADKILTSLKGDPRATPIIKGFVRNPSNKSAFDAVRAYLSKYYGLQFASAPAAADFLEPLVN